MKDPSPEIPKWADQFLSWYCSPDLLEEVQGDLYEEFVRDQQDYGLKAARRRFIWNVIQFFNFSTIKIRRHYKSSSIFSNMSLQTFYFIIRRLRRQPLNSFLHVLGLTVGLSVCFSLGMFIKQELNFDDYHQKKDRIYRVNQVWEINGEKEIGYGAPFPLADALRSEIPACEQVAAAFPLRPKVIEINTQRRFKEDRILMADAELLNIFDFTVLEGEAYEALRQPNQALLTESTAKRYFGEEPPLGKTFKYENEHIITVAGIIADLPANTHLPASIILSYFPMDSRMKRVENNWGLTFGASTYVLIGENADPEKINASIRSIYDQHLNTDSDDPEIGYAQLQSLSSIHLTPEVDGGSKWVAAINPIWLWFYGGIAILVLLLASINFINLSTAQALTRAKEVGIRKVTGASKGQLIGQFLSEAFLLILISSVLALLSTYWSSLLISQLTDQEISPTNFISIQTIGAVILFLILVGLLTGLYPAWLIAKIRPVTAMKASVSFSDRKSNMLRRGLIIAQFAISGALLIVLLIMGRQMDYFYQRNLGFNKENIITIPMPDTKENQVFKSSLTSLNGIKNVSFAAAAPASDISWTMWLHKSDLKASDRKEVRTIWADEQYDDLYNLHVLAGKFIENSDTNSMAETIPEELRVIKAAVNEELIKVLNLGSPDEALHQRFLFSNNPSVVEIVGVVKDFNISSLHKPIQPLIIAPLPSEHQFANIQLEAGINLTATLAAIQSSWTKIFPDQIYDFEFLDKTIERYYEAESRLYLLFKVFAGLAMLISCLGLWGIANFITVKRTKEIGIRKVMGASVIGLVKLLSKDFLGMVGISLFIAIPLAWYGMSQWLQNFAFHIEIKWTVFVLSTLIILAIAFFTVSFQSIKTALANPIQSLRDE